MSTLAEELSAYSQKRTSNEDEELKRKKPKTTTVYSQPADTGIGFHAKTQLHHAVEYIKKQDRPVTVRELQDYLNGAGGTSLLRHLRMIERIKYEAAANTYEYTPLHNIKSGEALLLYLRRQPVFRGLAVKELKDGWSGCLEAIDKLEKSQDILVLRTKKENIAKLVWANKGGDIGGVDEKFVKVWHRIPIPPPAELPQKLEEVGLKPTSVDPATVKKAPTSQAGKQKRPRKGKTTNTHLQGILKDFSGRR
ncbi:TFIIE beta subunit core domain-containing protein [Limtongia smithiae]|uniref:TFIIE beta subunit core domain-containing protein n=1 Tax=Limtongia smithiae TaxID=1125753 RepID=UPI0034CDF4D8